MHVCVCLFALRSVCTTGIYHCYDRTCVECHVLQKKKISTLLVVTSQPKSPFLSRAGINSGHISESKELFFSCQFSDISFLKLEKYLRTCCRFAFTSTYFCCGLWMCVASECVCFYMYSTFICNTKLKKSPGMTPQLSKSPRCFGSWNSRQKKSEEA